MWHMIALGAIVLALVATVVAVVALIVATSRSSSLAPVSTAPTYSAAEVSAAHQKLCDVYKLVARSVDIDTNTDNRALAGAVSVNAAVVLGQTIGAAPTMPSDDRAAAHVLASAYTKATAMGSALQRDDPVFRSEVDDVNAKAP
ncbi:hypothetical protein [Mycobacterium sp. 1465703.0]|uniref:hypothetical protein n=1 Tax=Mycobacterium sp. 1465703.0 TaxID=1834078 RepID=UPI001E56675D|nr:hypothetical protein [Mycobacterium sp. 1465703.0]